VLIIGDQELDSGRAPLRNMLSGEQAELELGAAAIAGALIK
jgi:histidyl-tRNA synthetase